MNNSRMLLLAGIVMTLLLAGCGRKGPLYLERPLPRPAAQSAPAVQPASAPVSVIQPEPSK